MIDVNPGGGSYSSMIWVGMCRWDLKSRPIIIPDFDETHAFLYKSHMQILSKIY